MTASSRLLMPAAAAFLLAIMAPTPAAAAASTVSSLGELQTALADCATAPNTITLSGDISAPATELTTGCDTTIDLGEHNLTVRNIIIGTGTTLEITGPVDGSEGTLTVDATGVPTIAGIRNTGATFKVTGGEVRATSGHHGAAIGGEIREDAGTLLVDGGTVHAVSTSAYGAAIGGGYPSGNGGVITVTGGSVVAETPSFYGVAVGGGGGGGGNGGSGATVTVTGGSLTAIATGNSSTAIGGGDYGLTGTSGSGGSLIIGPAGTVTASSPRSALGSGFALVNGTNGVFGKVEVDGTLYLPSGGLDVRDDPAIPHEIIVGATGRILGDPATPAAGASITGTGRIDNQGAIAIAPPATMVDGNNRLVTFDTGALDIRVFAVSFDAGYRTIPSPPVGTRWNTASNGLGTWFTPTSPTSGTGTTALYSVVPATIKVSSEPGDLTATAGVPYVFPATVRDPADAPLNPQPSISYTSPNCTIIGTNVFEVAGSCTIEASAEVDGETLATTFTIEIVAGPVQSLVLTPSARSVSQGKSLTFTVSGEDAYGNPVDTSAAILSSSVPTDEIAGRTVTFPRASPHTITAALGGVTDQVIIEVIGAAPAPAAAAAELSKTGADAPIRWGLTGITLLLMGALSAALARRYRREYE